MEAILKNVDNDRRRSQRQHVSLSVGDQEVLKDASGQVLLPPEEDPIVPKIPHTFPWDHRPLLWHDSPRVDTPKRVRTDVDSLESDMEAPSRPPKRRVSEKPPSDVGLDVPSEVTPLDAGVAVQAKSSLQLLPASQVTPLPTLQVTPYGATNRIKPKWHYSLSEIMNNPLRHYPPSLALYGTETDGTLSSHPAFSINFASGMDGDTFTRGENDPALCVLRALNAERVAGSTLEFCSWNDSSARPTFLFPFSDNVEIFPSEARH